MSKSYQALIAASGMTERKWRLVRQACRAKAKERGEDVMAIYARENVLTPRERQSMADPECAERRKVWRTNKKLAAENERLRKALAHYACKCSAEAHEHCCYGDESVTCGYRARAVLAEKESLK